MSIFDLTRRTCSCRGLSIHPIRSTRRDRNFPVLKLTAPRSLLPLATKAPLVEGPKPFDCWRSRGLKPARETRPLDLVQRRPADFDSLLQPPALRFGPVGSRQLPVRLSLVMELLQIPLHQEHRWKCRSSGYDANMEFGRGRNTRRPLPSPVAPPLRRQIRAILASVRLLVPSPSLALGQPRMPAKFPTSGQLPDVARFWSGNRAFLFPMRPDRVDDYPDFRATKTPASCATVSARGLAPANAGCATAL